MRISKKQNCGFVLLEVILATAFFSIAAVAFTTALHRVSETADLSSREMKITRVLDSALLEALSTPQMEVGETVVQLNEFGSEARLEVTTIIEELELENEDGAILPQMFQIKVIATWFQGREEQEREANTWRYGRIYQR